MVDDDLEVRVLGEVFIINEVLNHVEVVDLHALLLVAHHIFSVVLDVRLEFNLEGLHH